MSEPMTAIQVAKTTKAVHRCELAELLMFQFHLDQLKHECKLRLRQLQQPKNDDQAELAL